MVLLKDSKTMVNLMRAFAGESQARNRYTFAAEMAKKINYGAIERIFKYTADQERAHAKVYYDHLKELSGNTIFIDAGYPVDIYDDLLDVLKKSRHNEFEEHDVVYKEFGEIAREEGFKKIALDFEKIALVEKIHGERFERYAKYIEENTLFKSDKEEAWICLNCGNIHYGKEAPKICPICNYEQGYYIRFSESPFEK